MLTFILCQRVSTNLTKSKIFIYLKKNSKAKITQQEITVELFIYCMNLFLLKNTSLIFL